MAQVLAGERTLEEIIVESPYGLNVVPGASGIAELAELCRRLLTATGAGVQRSDRARRHADRRHVRRHPHSVVQFTQAAQHVLSWCATSRLRMTDAYALIKVLSRNHGVNKFFVLANQTRAPGEGDALFQKFQRVANRFLDVTLEYVRGNP